MKIKNIVSYSLSILVASIFCWYIFSIIDFKSMLNELSRANYFWIAMSVFISLISHLSRALRWNLLLKPLGYKVSIVTSFQSVLIGYLTNYFVPRMGEVARCSTIQKTDYVPINISLGTVITERVIDVVVMLCLVLLSFLIEFNKLQTFMVSFLDEKAGGLLNLFLKYYLEFLILFIFLSILLYIIVLNKNKLLKNPLINKVFSFMKGIFNGLISIKNLEKPWLFVTYTFIIWGGYYLMTYIIFFSMKETENLPAVAGLVTLGLASLGMAAPVQGGFGVYHFMVATALGIYGITQEKGLILATILHTSQFATMLVFGGVSLFLVVITLPKTYKNKPSSIN
jgi:glycosyltransferase 2 family protein